MIHAWLVAWLGGSAAFLAVVVAGYACSERRRLRRAGAIRPGVIVWKKLATRAVRTAGPFLDSTAAAPGDLAGASVWLEWDERWGPSGAVAGRIVRHVDRDGTPRLLIETRTPQALPRGSASHVWFVPRPARGLKASRFAAMRGTLHVDEPRGDEDVQDGELRAVLVVTGADSLREDS